MGKYKKKAFGAKPSKVEKKVKVNPFDLIGKVKKKSIQAPTSAALSRKRANESRQKTIGIEYKNFGKTNQIIDRRVAERSSKFSSVEKAEKRFVLQRKKMYASKNRFNLDDDKVPDDNGFPSDSKKAPIVESDDEENGHLGADLVALANFGGGSFEDRDSNGHRSYKSKRNEVLSNLIATSKQAKAARQMEKEAQLDKLDDLDDLFEKLQTKGTFSLQSSSSNANGGDSYDTMYRTLQFDGANPRHPEASKDDVLEHKKESLRHYGSTKVAASSNNKDDVVDRCGSLATFEEDSVVMDKSSSILEPDLDEENDSISTKKGNKGKSGRRTMKQKLRRETRGAMKELKKDAMYLAKLQNEQKLKVSKERKEKTNFIMQSLQVQESEYKKRKLKKF